MVNCLRPGREITDTLLNFYMFWIKKRKLTPTQREQVFILPTEFYQIAVQRIGASGVLNDHDASQLYKYVDTDEFFWKRKFLMFPIVYEHHFILAVVYRPLTAFEWLDATRTAEVTKFPKGNGTFVMRPARLWILNSLGKYGAEEYPKISYVVRKFLEFVYAIRPDVTRKSLEKEQLPIIDDLDIPQQPYGSNDCGFYALHFAETILRYEWPEEYNVSKSDIESRLNDHPPPPDMREIILKAFNLSAFMR